MKNEKSIKRAVLAVAACEGIYLAIGFVTQFIFEIAKVIVGELYLEGYDIFGTAVVILLIMFLISILITVWEYKLAMKLIPKITKNTLTEILGFRILGWLLICLSVIDFFVSLSDNPRSSNYGIIVGILYLLHARKLRKLYTAAKESQEGQKLQFTSDTCTISSDAFNVKTNTPSEKDILEDGSYV